MQKKILLLVTVLGLLLLVGCSHIQSSKNESDSNQIPAPKQSALPSAGQMDGLIIHYIDVGQGDAILIQTPAGENMLIDGGTNDDENLICSYLQEQNIKKIQVLVGTHPHEDHIGGLDAVIHQFPVENIYLPKIVHSTKTFEDLLLAVKSCSLKIKTAQAGVNIPLTGVTCTILSPQQQNDEEINDYSAVIKISYGEQSFLFCGDASQQVESDLLASGQDLKADIIKIAHHGSSSSSSKRFLKAVAPCYAVISCGQDNPYGHPHQETMSRLQKAGITVLRTDQSGTVIINADGKNQLDIYTHAGQNGGEQKHAGNS